jgi:ferredoxin--NADP+ reductase
LGYLAEHRELERRYMNYRYVPLTTREPANLDPNHLPFAGKLYIQDFVESEAFASRTQISLDPARVHVFLCGNPDMIGAPHHPRDPERRLPTRSGMIDLLESRGFRSDAPHEPGNIHFESYW